jgi:hypothetical protein
MVKFICGVAMLGFGVILFFWLMYNLLIARQREFNMSLCGLAFNAGLFYVGGKWAWEERPNVQKSFQPKRRRKKKKRRRVVEEEDE